MCKRCAVGHFKEFAGSEQCINKCPAFSSSAEGSTSIADCECDPGYTGLAAEADCKACDVGTYKTETSEVLLNAFHARPILQHSHLQALTRVIVHAASAFQQVTLVESCLLKNVFVQSVLSITMVRI